jgi:hypothetical protein
VLDTWNSISSNCCCCGGCCDCGGCSCEMYWSEWHNDPPQCCDPCDRCGNWIGPGGYRAPYAHAYAPAAHSYPPSSGVYAKNNAAGQPRTVRRPTPATAPTRVARQPKSTSAATARRR